MTENEQRILELIASFGETLERSLYGGEPWPENLTGNPQIARGLLIAVSFNMNRIRDLPLTKCVQTSGNLARYIHGPLHRQEPTKKLRWDAYRKIADPAIRRASLWITAWELMRERPYDLSPGWSKLPPHVEHMIRRATSENSPLRRAGSARLDPLSWRELQRHPLTMTHSNTLK
nr:hypothetical protein [Luteimonas sp. XNQY3]